ncbi:hypothetical protein TrST_g12709 [Triparma strigata]|nr:hypothetical protein TrST_g12709 [Triparma strigata]
MWKLRLHFANFAVIGEMAWAVYEFREGELVKAILHFVRLAALTVIFHFGLKLRAAVGGLPDEDLQTFLVDTLFKGGFPTLFSILFLTFRTTKCMFEEGSVAECSNTSYCSALISVYLLCWFFQKLVQGSVRSEWRKDLNLSIEKIARMRDISLRRGAAGFLTLLTGVCGIFLFSMMSADDTDDTTISVIGLTGLVASLGAVISEIYSSLKAQERRMELTESGEVEERVTEPEEPVEECSWVFVGVSFLFTSVFSVLWICYGVTLKDKYMLLSRLILPLVGLSWVMAVMYKPKRTDVEYMRFLFFHFFTIFIVSEVASAAGLFRMGLTLKGFFVLFRIPFHCLGLVLLMKLRASAATLPPQELSSFLCQTVLVKGTAAMVTMLFFSFETVSCFISQNSLDNGQCSNTSSAAAILSVYLAILTTMSIAGKAVPKYVQRETVWELRAIAELKGLKWWQQVQGGLLTIAAIVSLYLLSILGVSGDPNSTVFLLGASGAGSVILFALINLSILVLTRRTSNPPLEACEIQRSARGISATDVEENAFALALV